jgi:signal peptidase II
MTESASSGVRSRLLALALAMVLLMLDQVTKMMVLTSPALAEGGVAVTSYFNLVLVWNPGVSFGMLRQLGTELSGLIAVLTLLVVVILLGWLWRTTELLTALGIGLVIGGALGNVIDRWRFGAVVDFLDFHVAGWHWPAFNLADCGIVVGAAVLLLDGLLAGRSRAT